MPLVAGTDRPEVAGPLINRAVARSLARRRASYADEVERIVSATYEVIERTGSLDPTMRDILRQSGISTQAFYRHFRSKDELLLALLDDGRRQLTSYLAHRMAKADTAEGKLTAWIEGVLAQASDETAAAKTRPFLANLDRLAEQYPSDQQESVELLIGLVEAALGMMRPDVAPERARLDAIAIYHLAIGTMHQHIRDRTRPSADEVEHVIQFSLAAVARPSKGVPDDG
jgi:AcrR family transcriptional regulator